MDEPSCDRFLGGRLRLWQPKHGYRAGVDPVLLAAAVNATPGQSVLDLGCGVGAAGLCLAARVPGVALTGLEVQPDYAALARRNAAENAIPFEVVEGDLAALPAGLKARRFDHVMMNPPYYDRATGTAARDRGRELALGGELPLSAWVDVAARRLAPKGFLHVIMRAERLADLLSAVQARLGSLQLLPLIPRRGRDSQLVILRARKGGRAAFRLHDGLVLHEGAAHSGDRENYSAEIRRVLREGAALAFPS
ncbi:tRNA1(Val) (adenine(37)-N6)-methyltransferase [Aquicoccus sp. G2-2]|uniref:tRNA1(Val) (adenine(37)-N6)-methyltransferase n=1 Tax=Aquicoccus sp. G2-2 TaxID=3092120 RepID=UPI002ADF59AE|nr:methyltransferase [Aquicoccus sp. G2-2]MEA1112501.1 methyltransferase [Aquicoccus sp. G2-2]